MIPRCSRVSSVKRRSTTLEVEKTADDNAYPYVDVPQFCYSDWLANTQTIGAPSATPGSILIVGAGVSGACAAYELAQAGFDVTVVDAEDEVGGRCASVKFPCNTADGPDSMNLVELGAMRFPGSESIMDYYVKKFNILGPNESFVNDDRVFPDPGKVPTLFACGGVVLKDTWVEPDPLPEIFDKVHNGWVALVSDPLFKMVNGTAKKVLESMPAIRRRLIAGAVSEATTFWQQWVDLFGQQTFYGALFTIMTGHDSWVIPGGTSPEVMGPPWTFNDFDRFGHLGVGSGGFGALYGISFLEIMRLVVDGLEDTQYFFPPGIRALPLALMNAATGKDAAHPVKKAATLIKDVMVTKVKGSVGKFAVETKAKSSINTLTFDRVLVATTTRSMECTMNVAGAMCPEYDSSGEVVVAKLLSADCANAVRRVHSTSSIKVAAQIKKFWKDKGPDFPRVFLSDDIVRQIYTLDYGAEDTAVCFITYTWDDDAIRQQGLGVSLDATATTTTAAAHATTFSVDKQRVYRTLHTRLLHLARQNVGPEKNPYFTDYVNGLFPYNPSKGGTPEEQSYPAEAILYVEWQSLPSYNAAFKLSKPGEDQHVQRMFFDYQKAGTDKDTGVYLAGDTLCWTAGWVEGGLYTGLNAAAGLIKSLSGKVNDDPKTRSAQMVNNPLDINASQFNYFVPGVPAASGKEEKDAAAEREHPACPCAFFCL